MQYVSSNACNSSTPMRYIVRQQFHNSRAFCTASHQMFLMILIEAWCVLKGKQHNDPLYDSGAGQQFPARRKPAPAAASRHAMLVLECYVRLRSKAVSAGPKQAA